MSYYASKTLHHLIVRLDKKDSSFFYFTLESNDGLAFYSTLEDSLRMPYRDIELFYTPEYQGSINHLIGHCQKSFPIETLLFNDNYSDKLSRI